MQDLAKELLRQQINKSVFNCDLILSENIQIKDRNDNHILQDIIKEQKKKLKDYLKTIDETQGKIENMLDYIQSKSNQLESLVRMELEQSLDQQFRMIIDKQSKHQQNSPQVEDIFYIKELVQKIQEGILERNQRLVDIYINNTTKKRYKTSQELFVVTNKLQKLFSILKNKAVLESYIDLCSRQLLQDIKDRKEVGWLKDYLYLNVGRMGEQINKGGSGQELDKRLSIVRLQNIMKSGLEYPSIQGYQTTHYTHLANARFNLLKYSIYKALGQVIIQSSVEQSILQQMFNQALQLHKQSNKILCSKIEEDQHEDTKEYLLTMVRQFMEVQKVKEEQKQLVEQIKKQKEYLEEKYLEQGELLIEAVIEKQEDRRGEQVEDIVDELFRQLDYLMGEEEDYLEQGEELSERVRQALSTTSPGHFSFTQPLTNYINNNIYTRSQTRHTDDLLHSQQIQQLEEHKRQREQKLKEDRDKRLEANRQMEEKRKEERLIREQQLKQERERQKERREQEREQEAQRRKEAEDKQKQDRLKREEELRVKREKDKEQREQREKEEKQRRERERLLKEEKDRKDRQEREEREERRRIQEEEDRRQREERNRKAREEKEEAERQRRQKEILLKEQRENMLKEEQEKKQREKEIREEKERKERQEREQKMKQREEEERQRREREQEEKQKRQKEEEEKKRKAKEEREQKEREQKEERDRIKKQKEEEDRQRRIKEEEEKQRRKDEEDKLRKEREDKRKKEEEDKRLKREEEERLRKKKEEEDRQRRQKEEEERQKKKREEEEKERKRKEEEEKQRKKREEEERERKRKEEEERQRKKREEEERQKKKREEEERQKKKREEEEKERKRKEEEEKQRKKREEEERERERKKREEEEKQRKKREEEEKQRKKREEEEKQRKKREEEEKQRKKREEKERKRKEEEEKEKERKRKEEEERKRQELSANKKQSEDDYEEDFEFEEIEDIDEEIDYGMGKSDLQSNKNKKNLRQASNDGFEELDNMIDELDHLNKGNKPNDKGKQVKNKQEDYAFDLEDEELEIEEQEEDEEIYEEFENYDDKKQQQQHKQQQGEEEEEDDQIMPDYIISEQNIVQNNKYIQSTRYYRKDQKYDLQEFNNLDAFYFIFEEQVHQKKSFFLDFDHTNAFIELQERFMTECKMSSPEHALESIEEDLMTLDQGIKESYYQQMKELEFVETCRIFLPFTKQNKFKLMLMELNPYSSCNLMYFQEGGEELTEEDMEQLESLMMIVSQIFGNENYQNMNVELRPNQWTVLNHQDNYLPILLILFATLYDQDLPNFLQDYDTRLTSLSLERLFCVGQGFKEAFQLLEESFDQIEEYYNQYIQQFQEDDEKKFQVVISNYPAGVDFEELLGQVKQDLAEVLSQPFSVDMQSLVCLSLRFEQEEEEVINYYLHLHQTPTHLQAAFYFYDAFQNINQYILQIINSFKTAPITFQFYYDFARHNIVYEQSTLTIGTILKLITNHQYTITQAFNLVSYSLIPYIIEFENQ